MTHHPSDRATQPAAAEISADQFEAYKTVIRSGQMDAAAVPRFLADNPEFRRWYRDQAEAG